MNVGTRAPNPRPGLSHHSSHHRSSRAPANQSGKCSTRFAVELKRAVSAFATDGARANQPSPPPSVSLGHALRHLRVESGLMIVVVAFRRRGMPRWLRTPKATPRSAVTGPRPPLTAEPISNTDLTSRANAVELCPRHRGVVQSVTPIPNS